MFINYFSIYVYNNHKNYLIGGGEWKLLFERLALEWSDKSSFHSSPKSNWWTNDKIIIDLLTHFLQIIKSYPQNKWQTSDFLVQSYLKLGKVYIFISFWWITFEVIHIFSLLTCVIYKVSYYLVGREFYFHLFTGCAQVIHRNNRFFHSFHKSYTHLSQ